MAAKKAELALYEIKILLQDSEPPIWRRVRVPRDILLFDLHTVIQFAMGWQNDHLHEFVIAKKRYGEPQSDQFDFGMDVVDEGIVRLNGVAKKNAKFLYLYDFGDDWRHLIHIEREIIDPANTRSVICCDGANACPPEDIGGIYGYAEKVAILADANDPEHKEMRKWMGEDFDPSHFDLALTNQCLAGLEV